MFNNDDLIRYKAFKKIVDVGDFEIKGNATITVALLFRWFNELESKIEGSINKPLPAPKEKKEKIKKV